MAIIQRVRCAPNHQKCQTFFIPAVIMCCHGPWKSVFFWREKTFVLSICCWPQNCWLLSCVTSEMSDLHTKWLRFNPNGTNLGLFLLRFNYILARRGQSDPFWNQISQPWVGNYFLENYYEHCGVTQVQCYFLADPPENCQLNVKKLTKTWHFFSKKLTKIVIFSTKLPMAK